MDNDCDSDVVNHIVLEEPDDRTGKDKQYNL